MLTPRIAQGERYAPPGGCLPAPQCSRRGGARTMFLGEFLFGVSFVGDARYTVLYVQYSTVLNTVVQYSTVKTQNSFNIYKYIPSRIRWYSPVQSLDIYLLARIIAY